MKTKTFFGNLVNTLLWFLLMALLGSLGAGIVHGQKLSIGASLSEMASGSGLGSSVSPQLTINTERQIFSAGINIQSQHGNFTGLRGRYAFICNPQEAMEIFFFYDIASHNRAFLGKQTAAQESFLNPELAGYFDNARIKTIEQHIGFGMNVFVWNSLKMFGAVGVGHYNTMNCKEQNLFLYREKNNCSLMLMAGVKIDIKRIR